MKHSFKLKISLFALGTSGAILLAFSALFLAAIRRAALERVDRHLQALAEGQLRRPFPTTDWARFNDSLSSVYGEPNAPRFLLCVFTPEGEIAYRSPGWPASLDAAALFATGPSRDGQIPSFRPPEEDTGEPPAERLSPQERPPRPLAPYERPLARREQAGRPRPPRLDPPKFQTVRVSGQPWRFILARSPNATLLLGNDMAEAQAEIRRFLSAYAFVVPLGLILLASGGWLLANQALKPIRALTDVAEKITAKDMSRRVQADDADQEFRALIDVINGMLNRLEISFAQAARFSADAAHELKTPLTILQGQLSQALKNAPADSEVQRTYADLLDEVQRLKAIVRKLLLLAQSDAGQLHPSLQPFSLNRELEALFEDVPLLAPDLTATRDLAPDVTVSADPDLMRQALQNLISNAIKYNRPQGTITCTLLQEESQAVVEIANTLPLDAVIDRSRLFDRFYRGDAAHSRKVDGTGLGLSLAREICRAHGGDLTADIPRAGWIVFRLTLPINKEGFAFRS